MLDLLLFRLRILTRKADPPFVSLFRRPSAAISVPSSASAINGVVRTCFRFQGITIRILIKLEEEEEEEKEKDDEAY